MQYWQKRSFPFRLPSQDSSDPDGWRRVRKQRQTSRFSLTSGQITAHVREPADEARCAVELTEIRAHCRDWWFLGLEATGPADLLRAEFEATAALVFSQALPDGDRSDLCAERRGYDLIARVRSQRALHVRRFACLGLGHSHLLRCAAARRDRGLDG